MTSMPEGYKIHSVSEDRKTIVVAMDFRHAGKECAKTITYEGLTYKWGSLEAIPPRMAGEACCLRTYTA